MSITRYSQRRGIGPEYMAEDSNGEYVRHCDYLAAVESLEYDIRYEREQKEELQDELRCTKEEYVDIIYRLEERITELEDEVKELSVDNL